MMRYGWTIATIVMMFASAYAYSYEPALFVIGMFLTIFIAKESWDELHEP